MNKETKTKKIVEEKVVSTIIKLGVPYRSSVKEVGLQEAARTTLKEHANGTWNSKYTAFIEKNYQDIEAIANGEKVKYITAIIYRDAETELLEIEEISK